MEVSMDPREGHQALEVIAVPMEEVADTMDTRQFDQVQQGQA